MTGWRLGYALAPAPIINAMTKLQSQSTSSTAHMVQMAGLAAVTGPQDCVEKMKKDYIQLRDLTLGHLSLIPGVTCVKPEGAFYVYPNVSAYFGKSEITSAADVAKRLLHEAHVVTVPGEAFGTRDHIRLSYAPRRPRRSSVAWSACRNGSENSRAFSGNRKIEPASDEARLKGLNAVILSCCWTTPSRFYESKIF